MGCKLEHLFGPSGNRNRDAPEGGGGGSRRPSLPGGQKSLVRKDLSGPLLPGGRSRESSSDWPLLGLLTSLSWTREQVEEILCDCS